MGEIADDREGFARAAPHQHPPIHFGEFLCFVDHDVPVGPIPIRGSAFGEFAGVALKEAVGQVLGVDHVLGAQLLLVLHRVLARNFEEAQHAGGVLGLVIPLPLSGLIGLLVGAQQVDQLVEQWNVRHRPGLAVGAAQRLVGARRVQPFGGREERGQQRFGCQYRPEPVERGDELLVLGELVEQVRPQFLPGCPIIPGQPAPADAGDRPFGEHPRDDVSEHRARVVVRQPAGACFLPGPLRRLRVDPHRDVRQFDQ